MKLLSVLVGNVLCVIGAIEVLARHAALGAGHVSANNEMSAAYSNEYVTRTPSTCACSGAIKQARYAVGPR